jgi:hypothetical protein
MTAEFGSPPWTLGLKTYLPLPASTSDPSKHYLLAGYSDPGSAGANLGVVDVSEGKLHPLDSGLSGRFAISVAEVEGKLTLVVAAGSPTKANAVRLLQVRGVVCERCWG